MAVSDTISHWPDLRTRPISPLLRARYYEGLVIALEYLNAQAESRSSRAATILKAEQWCRIYYGSGRRVCTKQQPGGLLLEAHPHLFDFSVPPHLRLEPAAPSPTTMPPGEKKNAEAGGDAEEPFPPFEEPTVATPAELDDIIDLRKRHGQPPPAAATAKKREKPTMRVTPDDLRGSAVLSHLPEFLNRLSRPDPAAGNNSASGGAAATMVELDDEAVADGRQHIEVNLLAGVLEEQRRTQQQQEEEEGGVRLWDGGESDEEGGSGFQMALPTAGSRPSRPLVRSASLVSSTSSDSTSSEESASSSSSSSSGSDEPSSAPAPARLRRPGRRRSSAVSSGAGRSSEEEEEGEEEDTSSSSSSSSSSSGGGSSDSEDEASPGERKRKASTDSPPGSPEGKKARAAPGKGTMRLIEEVE